MHKKHKGIDRQNETFNQRQKNNAKVTFKLLRGLLQGAMFFTGYLFVPWPVDVSKLLRVCFIYRCRLEQSRIRMASPDECKGS